MTPEEQRLSEARTAQTPWKKWGPYLSERQWGTVREDYSAHGDAWNYFPYDHSRSRAYRWGEDGLAGISDECQYLCFALALWNGQDPHLKERLFGLAGPQGNHGEDVKEYYFYLDNTPTHSWMQYLYKYPQRAFPYEALITENHHRLDSPHRGGAEYELLDTGVFEENRYFDVFVEYAKADPENLLIQIRVINRGPEAAPVYVLPTLWFRNTWSWTAAALKPTLQALSSHKGYHIIGVEHPDLGQYGFYYQDHATQVLFTENESNIQLLFNAENPSPYVKDGIHNAVVNHQPAAVNPAQVGTKVSPCYTKTLAPGESYTIQLRLSNQVTLKDPFGPEFADIFQQRQAEADQFYAQINPGSVSPELQRIQRQALAGLLWSKQYFGYWVEQWLKGDEAMPKPPSERLQGRNHQWTHLDNQDIISMPDKWEYPWYASWDLAFHCIALALVDLDFAKKQLDLMTREWFMHPNGQIPAYEWNFGDVNPPVHAWATWRVYKYEQQRYGQGDLPFLERVFQKLLLNFTWWVNRKDSEGKNVFEGGFLGLDNIGVFNRSEAFPDGGRLEQSDGTSWMAMYCLNMLTMALELAQENCVYEDMATKFFEHFIYIADAMNHMGNDSARLWDEEDGFYYDCLLFPNGHGQQIKIRSMVGLIPLYAVTTLEPDLLEKVPGFKARLEWFIANRQELKRNVACMETKGQKARRLLALCYATLSRVEVRDRLRRILTKLLDEQEFLSDYGIRALSKYHEQNPYLFELHGETYRVDYDPAESRTGLFGGNSNWRGPVWLPVNYLIIESLQEFHHYLGDDFKIECPTGSGQWLNLREVSIEISRRLLKIFLPDEAGQRPVFRETPIFNTQADWQNLLLFYEYFHGDNGRGVGASHQTGWTGLVAKLIQDGPVT